MATRTRVKRLEYVNDTQGFLGAVKLDRNNQETSVPVPPGERVFLTNEERDLTEQAHVRAETSPFRQHEIIHRDPMTGDETKRFVGCPLRLVTRPGE